MQKNKSENKQHLAIIGSGSAAFAAATKAVEKGARVTIIEAAEKIGGTCVNIGCVPSKIFIRGAYIAHLQNQHNIKGIKKRPAEITRKLMVEQQQEWVDKLRYAKYENILNKNPDITLLKGMASFKDSTTLIIKNKNADEDADDIEISPDKILIAVGSRAKKLEIQGLEKTPYWTSTEALVAEQLPKHLVVLGGSVVALELAQAFCFLGVKVTLMSRSTLLSKEDASIGEALCKRLKADGMDIKLHTVAKKITHDGDMFSVETEEGVVNCDQLLVAAGRVSNADGLSLEKAGVKSLNAEILINEYMQTNVSHIYAAGDCTTQPQYVYVAAAAGTRAALNIMGEKVAINLSVMPAVVFTEPQIATVGLSEEQANTAGIDAESRTLTLDNVPRALANLDTRGFIKLVAEKQSGKIIGCQIIANNAGDVIQTAALAIQNEMTVKELANQLFPYLTMVEGLKLTAQTFHKDVKFLSCCAG